MFRVLKKGHKPETFVCYLKLTVVRRISDKLVPALYANLEQGGTVVYKNLLTKWQRLRLNIISK